MLTAFDLMPPALLLTFTFLLGACLALTLPAYQVFVQELVPRDQVRMVASLGGVAVNGARAVGPALAGVLVAQVGPAVVFAVTAAGRARLRGSCSWLRGGRRRQAGLPPERFRQRMRAGGRYVRNSPAVRRMLLRVFLFVLPGRRDLGAAAGGGRPTCWTPDPPATDCCSARWARAPSSGAAVLPRVGTRLSANRLLVVSGVLFAGSLLACVSCRT